MLKEWFLNDTGESFIAFGSSHLIMLSIYFICVFLILFFRKEIQSNNTTFQLLRWTFFALLVGSEVIYQTWTSFQGIWRENLPFHLCGVAGIIGSLALLTLNKRLIAISFFIGLIPAFAALVTPELPYDFPSFRFFKFFIHHMAISLTSIFLAVISTPGYITLTSTLYTYIYLVIYAIFVGIVINPWLDANYLFLAHPPTASTPLDLLGSGYWYHIHLGLLAMVVFLIQYMFYRLLRKSK